MIGIGFAATGYEWKLQTDQILKTGLKSKATVIRQTRTENKKVFGSRKTDYKKYTYWPIYEFNDNRNQLITIHRKLGGVHVTMGKVNTVYYNPRDPGREFVIVKDNWTSYLGVVIVILFIVACTLL